MELNEVFKIVEKNLNDANAEYNFNKASEDENSITFTGDKGSYRIVFDSSSSTMAFECANDGGSEFNTISKSLFDLELNEERDAKSLANEVAYELEGIFKSKKKVDLEKVKMPKAVSRTKAKNGIISYDMDSLANRFGACFPECKDDIKANIVEYGEFLPETYFKEHGTEKVLDIIKNGNEADRKKLFKMLNEVYEDGTNDVQDVIGVSILGEMKNDPAMMEVADKYMSDYMSGPVHEINKITQKKNGLTKKLENPPAYKPKKNKSGGFFQTLMSGGQGPSDLANR